MNGSNLRFPKRKRKVYEYIMPTAAGLVIIGCWCLKAVLKEKTN